MYVRDEYTGQIKVDDGDFYVEAYRKKVEFQEIDLSRSVAVTDCVRKALRVMGVRDEVESVSFLRELIFLSVGSLAILS